MFLVDPPSPSDGPNRVPAGRIGSIQNMNDEPPMSVIVLRNTVSFPSGTCNDNSPEPSDQNAIQDGACSRSFCSPPVSASPPVKSVTGAFRLQPRNPKCIPSPSSEIEDSRKKKRRAHSLSEDMPVSSALTSSGSDAMTAVTHTTTKGSPMMTPRTADHALTNFQSLSLLSPVSSIHNQKPPHQSASESPVSFVGSQSNRSSFLRYNASASPTSYIAGTSPSSGSFLSKSPSCSPKRAPCTVLFGHPLHRMHVTDSNQGSSMKNSRGTSPTAVSKRPPLHGGMTHHMQSLDDTPGKAMPMADQLLELPISGREPPIGTVHCHHHASALLASPGSHDSRLTDCTSYNLGPTLLSTPCSKASRHHELDSPSRGATLSASTTTCLQTPLPKLSLTPRSAASQQQRRTELPVFPMDLDAEVGAATFETSSSAQGLSTPPSIIRHDDRKQDSFFPVIDWEPKKSESIMHNTFQSHSTSLLQPPQLPCTDPLEMIIAARAPHHTSYDNDSLSATDDEDDFFLATPSVINEEKKTISQAQFSKQRKLDLLTAEVPPRRLSSVPSMGSGLASNASLLGMDFIASSSNLQNMDQMTSKVHSHSSFDELSHLHQRNLQECGTLRREESQASIGLAIEPSHADRDLETPPVIISQPKSPPPLLNSTQRRTDSDCDDLLLLV